MAIFVARLPKAFFTLKISTGQQIKLDSYDVRLFRKLLDVLPAPDCHELAQPWRNPRTSEK